MRSFALVLLLICALGHSFGFAAAKPDLTLLQDQLKLQCREAIGRLQATQEGTDFLDELNRNTEALTEFFCAGEPRDSHSGTLERLFKIHRFDPKCLSDSITGRIAVAAAFQCVHREREETDDEDTETAAVTEGVDASERSMLSKYAFFRDSYRANELHASFSGLHAGYMRHLFMLGNVADLEYLQNTIHIPLYMYGGMHGYGHWARENEFGESVHGGDFRDTYYKAGMSRAESIVVHGGVCGARSSLAVMHAASRGIPGQTVGAEQHCAYTLFLPGKGWQIIYGGRCGGSVDEPMFGGICTGMLMISAKALEHFDVFVESMSHLWRAEQAGTKTPASLPHIEKALQVLPDNCLAWNALVDTMVANKANYTPADWDNLSDRIVRQFGEIPGPHVALGRKYLRDEVIGSGERPTERLVKLMGQGQWVVSNCRPLVMLMRSIYKSGVHDKDLFRRLIMKEFVDEPFFGELVSHMEERLCKKPAQRSVFQNELFQLIADTEGADSGNCRLILKKALTQALQNKDAAMFHRFSTRARQVLNGGEKARLESIPTWDPLPGDLLTAGGFFCPPPAPDGSLFLYAGMFDEQGGSIDLKTSESSSLTVSFGKPGTVSGLIVQTKANGKLKEEADYQLSLSQDGKRWTQVAQCRTQPANWRVTLPVNGEEYGFARITCRNPAQKGQTIEFQRFAVFGERRR